ncbi:MAG: tRNA (N6-isopentenyl adenosine(37)-C2)-methylthiotransferase MiaB [Verrucomicrobiota bacterium]
MPSVYIKTYGCQMNERDSEQVAQQLQSRGYTLASQVEQADVVLLNTCSVRDMAEQKAINKMEVIQNSHKRRNPQVLLGFMGCMAQSRGNELIKRLPGLDLVVGTQKYHRVADYVDRLIGIQQPNMDDLCQSQKAIVDIEAEAGSQNMIRDHAHKDTQVTAFVSIMQGCNMKCTFCIVPYTRGSERSRPIQEIVDETKKLVSKGVREVTLLGQIVNLYGRNEFERREGRSPFVQLLYALQEVEGLDRIRFTSPHPIGYKKDLVQAFGNLSKLCEHIHLPLQSGSDRLLKKMHRGYSANRYRELVNEMREVCPHIAITTDIIVGFPGETEQDYLETRKLVEDVQFDNAFIFRYSERKDTPAALMDEKVAEETKMERNKDLLAVMEEIAQRRAQEAIGETVEVLVEGPSKTKKERLSGRTRTNKIVVFEGDERHKGQLLDLKIVDATSYTFYGDPVILV